MQKRKLNIAFNIDHFMPHRGGAERYLLNLVVYLLQHGHTVHVFAMDGDNTVENPHFHFHKIPVLSWFRWLKSLLFIVNSSGSINRYQFDIVHVLGKNLTMNVFQPHGGSHRAWFKQNCLSISEKKYVRWIYAVARLLDAKLLLFFIVESLQLRKKKLPRILAISQRVADDLRTLYDIPPSAITVIENGIDCKRFSLNVRTLHRTAIRQAYGLANKKVMLFVGNNFRLKGLRYFLLVLRKISTRRTDIAAVIIGSGNYKKFQRYARRYGVDNYCVFISQTEGMEQYYGAADVLVLPTFYDPFGLVVPEALACGLPVITTRFCGASNIIRQGITGELVDMPFDVDGMAACAEKFLYEIDSHTCAQEANKSIQCYDNTLIFAKILEYYHSILDENGVSVP